MPHAGDPDGARGLSLPRRVAGIAGWFTLISFAVLRVLRAFVVNH
jgi:hypothetical protein